MDSRGLADKRAYLAVLGCLMLEPSLLDDIDRPLDRMDFNTESFYELLFVAIYNLHIQGCETIDEFNIDSYLSNYQAQYATFQENQGVEYLINAREMAQLENYDYYYHRVRKYSLLRYYERKGLDTRFIYDSTLVETEAAKRESIKFDNYTEQDIVAQVELDLVITPDSHFCTNALTTNLQAAHGMRELVEELQETPDVGVPLNNDGLNTVARGARKGCVYMRSASSGGGKSRTMAGDVCKVAVPYVYNLAEKKWEYTAWSEPTLYITTEMPPDQIQTLFIAAVSKVNEEHILMGTCTPEEAERVQMAITYIEASPLYIVHVPDFSIEDIKNIIKKYHREFSVDYIAFDYIHTSLRLMNEISKKSGGGLKEYQMLLVFITELKTLAQVLNVFIATASQLNGEAKDARYKDQNLLAGSKAVANKLDVGMIAMPPNHAEKKRLEPILSHMINMPEPNMGYWIYKVRRGRLTTIILWSYIDLGTMTEKPLFVTDFDFHPVDMDFMHIEQVESKLQEHSVLMTQVPDAKEPESLEEITQNEESESEEATQATQMTQTHYTFDW